MVMTKTNSCINNANIKFAAMKHSAIKKPNKT